METQQLDEDLTSRWGQCGITSGVGGGAGPGWAGSGTGRHQSGPVIVLGGQRSVQQAPLTTLDYGFGAIAHAERLEEEGNVLFDGVL